MKNKMAECFTKVNHEQEIRYLLDIKQQSILYHKCLYYKTIMPFALVAYEFIANSLAMSSYTPQAHGIIVIFIFIILNLSKI